ncbi:MAG: hypothetical protein E6J10_05200 [Chloroflexi bacterium]|nr:MAG: hypothetical protein E6J10_05200 [Chloroflexota bacterium]
MITRLSVSRLEASHIFPMKNQEAWSKLKTWGSEPQRSNRRHPLATRKENPLESKP